MHITKNRLKQLIKEELEASQAEPFAPPEIPCPDIPRSDGLNSDVEKINMTLKPLGLQLYLTVLESLPAQLKLHVGNL